MRVRIALNGSAASGNSTATRTATKREVVLFVLSFIGAEGPQTLFVKYNGNCEFIARIFCGCLYLRSCTGGGAGCRNDAGEL
jgi:hypothetical protein